MSEIKKTLQENKYVPFILTKMTDITFGEDNPIYFLSLESDIDKTSVDICGVVDSYKTKEEMDKIAEELTKEYDLELKESLITL